MSLQKPIRPSKPAYDSFLPPTQCYRQMHDRLQSLEKANKVSMGEIVRQAVENFLDTHLPKENDLISQEKEIRHNGHK